MMRYNFVSRQQLLSVDRVYSFLVFVQSTPRTAALTFIHSAHVFVVKHIDFHRKTTRHLAWSEDNCEKTTSVAEATLKR